LAADLINISEIFFSIQGESSYAGLPCLFIRLHGCNLRCHYCDSRYTFEGSGTPMSIADILAQTREHPEGIVEITGGEPLCQEGAIALMEALVATGRLVLLETNGSLDLSPVPDEVVKIVDLKCPESGMHEKMFWQNLRLLSGRDELKCVIASRADYEWAIKTLKEFDLLSPQLMKSAQPQILFSAVSGTLSPRKLAEWILADDLPVRLQLQLHKLLWPEIERGV